MTAARIARLIGALAVIGASAGAAYVVIHDACVEAWHAQLNREVGE